jgi:hypothetical protein
MGNKNSKEKRIFVISLVAFIIGTLGYFLLSRDFWVFYLVAHIGALGVMGLFGCLVGYLANKKQRGYWTAFLLGSLLPIILGLIAVIVFYVKQDGVLYCGGSVSLLVALLVVLSYLVVKKKRLI